MAIETITLGGGRFWDLDAVYRQIRGVKSVIAGYSGGHLDYPTYEDVCSGDSGHAEVVRIEFDTEVLDFENILEVFFKVHDAFAFMPSTEYLHSPHRSVIFCHSQDQKDQAQLMVRNLVRCAPARAVLLTQIKSCTVFFSAEPEHQNFYKMHRNDPYCREFILPKIGISRGVFNKRLAA
ncbi:peptide-methionine (S)-S-oxide reductase MsrA [Undibacterium fentianense]|uniref:Peptide methionine sulfoxide reductase MsrA n=1 Tax=Undibacterium fentianense TaxID=2828728 RepID=A0A941E0J8_9BURK|nr:peptide-methionine (S)-S-oxide reductase MsrA [Undibacterium fentianense]MBR7800979.1 peptide-methionine (S)-S-oxide reductase MsrA [Undibacterium fentianense]